MAVYELDGMAPQLDEGAWVADSAQVIGNVHLGQDASVWFGVVVRGDNELMRIGRATNIQDLSALHSDAGVPLTIGDTSLIGIGAVVLNKARIGRNCIVGSGSVVTEGKEFPDNSLIIGAPAKVVRTLDDAAVERLRANAEHYIRNSQRFAKGLRRIG